MELNNLIEYKNKINDIKNKINILNESLHIVEIQKRSKELETETLKDGFWNNEKYSGQVLIEIKSIKSTIDKYNNLKNIITDAEEIVNMLEVEDDSELENELRNSIAELEEKTENLMAESLMSDEYDNMNAIVTIHPGAGGTESQDWALMLYRMYTRWAERNIYQMEIYDLQDAEEAGIKSVTFLVKGDKAYGKLKSEKGVHRLVRISPFDSNSRRHTSFAAVDVIPEIDEDIEIDIKDEDLEIGTYRASGAGGQHINKTDSAVRIKHIPTGIVVACQTERSQFQNKDNAMKMLKAKIYQLELSKSKEKLSEIKGENSDNSWGNQIRSYVFCPYTLVKDHRTNYEIGNIQKVMDGYIDDFITEYLKWKK